jgi:hypothetical protein
MQLLREKTLVVFLRTDGQNGRVSLKSAFDWDTSRFIAVVWNRMALCQGKEKETQMDYLIIKYLLQNSYEYGPFKKNRKSPKHRFGLVGVDQAQST